MNLFIVAIFSFFCLLSQAIAQSGYQNIQGTRVFTRVDQSAGVATFSNDCGTQTLTQRQLQAGAIPSQIIPCPRTGDGDRSRNGNTDLNSKEIAKKGEALLAKAIDENGKDRFHKAWTLANDAGHEFVLRGLYDKAKKANILADRAKCLLDFFSATDSISQVEEAIASCKNAETVAFLNEYMMALKQKRPARYGTRGKLEPTLSCSPIADTDEGYSTKAQLCREAEEMTSGSPYNTGSNTIYFRSYSGEIIEVPPGHGFYRNRDTGVLELLGPDKYQWVKNAMALSKETADDCRKENTSVFYVLVRCEMKRHNEKWIDDGRDDAYENYMNSRNSSSGGRNNGQLR